MPLMSLSWDFTCKIATNTCCLRWLSSFKPSTTLLNQNLSKTESFTCHCCWLRWIGSYEEHSILKSCSCQRRWILFPASQSEFRPALVIYLYTYSLFISLFQYGLFSFIIIYWYFSVCVCLYALFQIYFMLTITSAVLKVLPYPHLKSIFSFTLRLMLYLIKCFFSESIFILLESREENIYFRTFFFSSSIS